MMPRTAVRLASMFLAKNAAVAILPRQRFLSDIRGPGRRGSPSA